MHSPDSLIMFRFISMAAIDTVDLTVFMYRLLLLMHDTEEGKFMPYVDSQWFQLVSWDVRANWTCGTWWTSQQSVRSCRLRARCRSRCYRRISAEKKIAISTVRSIATSQARITDVCVLKKRRSFLPANDKQFVDKQFVDKQNLGCNSATFISHNVIE
jgi:hypothetical protein